MYSIHGISPPPKRKHGTWITDDYGLMLDVFYFKNSGSEIAGHWYIQVTKWRWKERYRNWGKVKSDHLPTLDGCVFFSWVYDCYYQIDSWQPRTPPLKLASFVTDCNSLPTIDHSKKEHIIQLSSVVHHNKPTQNRTWDARASAACVKRLKDPVVPSSVDLSALGGSSS